MIHGRKSVAVGVIVGLAVFAASALVVSRAVTPGESPALRVIHGLSDSLYLGIWQFIQFGVFVAIPFLIVAFASGGLGRPTVLIPHLPARSQWLPLHVIGGAALGRAEWVAT